MSSTICLILGALLVGTTFAFVLSGAPVVPATSKNAKLNRVQVSDRQPTNQPANYAVLPVFRVFRQSPRCCMSLKNLM
jgi:hypothetical protein